MTACRSWKRGQEEILELLARHDDTLQGIGASIDRGFKQGGRAQPSYAYARIMGELQALRVEVASAKVAPQLDVPQLSVNEIYQQANAYQQDAMKWISARNAKTASQRLAQGRELLMARLKREPNNTSLLVSLGYIEKAQAQVEFQQGNQERAVTVLGEAAKYFVKAVEHDPTNVSAINGMANVYLYACDYNRAIRLGKLVFEQTPIMVLRLGGKAQGSWPRP